MALAKSTAIVSVDVWQTLTAALITDGTAKSVSNSYHTIAYLEIAPIEAVATDGAEGFVEISYGDDDWQKLQGSDFKATAETPATTQTAEDPTSAGDTTVTLDDATTGDFDVLGRKWFIRDVTLDANSESVRTKSEAGNVVTLLQDTMREHAVNSNCYDRVDEWEFIIPFGVSYYRFIVHNVDADCDIMWRSWVSVVTAMS